jgi:hypothetical protein
MDRAITLRPAYADDALALLRLAELDSTPQPPPAPLLLAEVDGVLRAALSRSDGTAIADPFVPTATLIELLRQAAQAEAAAEARATRPRRAGLRRRRAARAACA